MNFVIVLSLYYLLAMKIILKMVKILFKNLPSNNIDEY